MAVAQDRDPGPVRTLPTFTPDLVELANWLAACGVTTAATEATNCEWLHYLGGIHPLTATPTNHHGRPF